MDGGIAIIKLRGSSYELSEKIAKFIKQLTLGQQDAFGSTAAAHQCPIEVIVAAQRISVDAI